MCVTTRQGHFCIRYIHCVFAGQRMGENFLKTWLPGVPPLTREEGLLWLAWWLGPSP